MVLKVLKKGSKGTAVKSLQMLLVGHGFYCGTKNGNGVDGDFGNLTLKAVKEYQTSRKLTVDGIVGSQTWTKLLI